MSDRASVLYDAPGPKAKVRNWIFNIVFATVVIAIAWWVLTTLSGKGELDSEKWSPFLTADVWTEFLLPGLWNTVKAALISVVLALPVGALLGVARLSDHSWVRWPAGVVVEFFRAIPVLIMMVFAYELFSLASQEYTFVDPADVPLFAVVTGLVLYNGSVLAEVFRAGILSVPRGQTEAAYALGLGKTQLMTQILLPQAITAMLPAIVSQLVVILKDTALGGQLIIGYAELLRTSGNVTANYHNNVATYAVVAVIYIVINFALTQLAGLLERKMRSRGRGKPGKGELTTLPPVDQLVGPPGAVAKA
jgi:glutamate transport system permease protein